MPPPELQLPRHRGKLHSRSASNAASDAASNTSSVAPAPSPAVHNMLRNTMELGNVEFATVTRPYRTRHISRRRYRNRRSASFDSAFDFHAAIRGRSSIQSAGSQCLSQHSNADSSLNPHDSMRAELSPISPPELRGSMPGQLRLRSYVDHHWPSHPLHSHRSFTMMRHHDRSHEPLSHSYMRTSARAARLYTNQNSRNPYTFRPVPSSSESLGSASHYSGTNNATARTPSWMHPTASHHGAELVAPPSPRLRGRQIRHGELHSLSLSPGLNYEPSRGQQNKRLEIAQFGSATVSAKSHPVSPQYYDYSESFLEVHANDFNDAAEVTSLTNIINQTIHEDQALTVPRAQTPFGTKAGSVFRPSELPTKHNRRSSEDTVTQLSTLIPERRSSIGFATQPPPHNHLDNNALQTRSSPGVHYELETSDSDICLNSGAFSKCPVAGDDSKNVNHKAETSSARLVQGEPVTTEQAVLFLEASIPRPRTTALELPPEFTGRYNENDCSGQPDLELCKAGPFTSTIAIMGPPQWAQERSALTNEVLILSPKPERPISSHSQKHFNKIFELSGPQNRSAQSVETILAPSSQTTVKTSSSESSVDIQEVKSDIDKSSPPQKSVGTPGRERSAWAAKSQGRSTIESLLDRHIESLGLGTGSGSPSEKRSISSSGMTLESNTDQSVLDTTTVSPCRLIACPQKSQGNLRALACYDRNLEPVFNFEPRQLFPDAQSCLSRLGPKPLTGVVRSISIGSGNNSPPSGNWQTLASRSSIEIAGALSKSSTLSGELADVEVSVVSKRFKMRSRSELRTSVSSTSRYPSLESIILEKPLVIHKRSRSENLARQESHRRRRLRIRMKLERRSRSVPTGLKLERIGPASREVMHATAKDNALHIPTEYQNSPAELGGKPVGWFEPPSRTGSEHSVPVQLSNRWSAIIAAMPPPGKALIPLPRKASTRTHRSVRSNVSLINPVNNSRIGSRMRKPGSAAPILAKPDLGPPLVSSDWNLSDPYATEPSTIGPSIPGTESFVDDRPLLPVPMTVKRLFGLSSLRSILPPSPRMSRMNGLGPYDIGYHLRHSWRMKKEESGANKHRIASSNSASKTRVVADRVRAWWRGHCIQRRLTLRERRATDSSSGSGSM